MRLLLSNSSGVIGAWVQFASAFKTDQQVLKAVWRSLRLVARRSIFFETLIAFDTSAVLGFKLV